MPAIDPSRSINLFLNDRHFAKPFAIHPSGAMTLRKSRSRGPVAEDSPTSGGRHPGPRGLSSPRSSPVPGRPTAGRGASRRVIPPSGRTHPRPYGHHPPRQCEITG